MTNGEIIGLVVVVLLGCIGGFMIVKKSKSQDLWKWLGLFILLGMSLTWIFNYGNFNGAEYYDYGLVQEGLTDIPNAIYNAIYFAGDKIVYLLALGAFYGVLNKSKGYKKLVSRVAEVFKGKEILYAIMTSLVVTVMTTLVEQTFIVLMFVPFLISVALRMRLDKLSAFSITFGSILIGLLGATYGGEGLYWFNYYTGVEVGTGIIYRLIVLVIGYLLFNFITVMHVRKSIREKVNEEESDPYKVEKIEDKAKAWPIGVILIVMFILLILGYVNWQSIFGITIFNEFHEWLMGIKIGEYGIISGILGTQTSALGLWGFIQNSTTILIGTALLIVGIIVVALISRMSLSEIIDGCEEGSRKISKSVWLYIGVYTLMLVAYMSPFIPTITNLMVKGLKTFNPYIVSIVASISHIFHTDLGFTGYAVAGYFTETYANNVELIHTIFVTLYGYIGMIVPTSGLLLIGLSYLDINYKSWLKYIWMFIVGMLIILLVLFTILAYV